MRFLIVGLKLLLGAESHAAGFAFVWHSCTYGNFSTSTDHYSYHTSFIKAEFLKFGEYPSRLGPRPHLGSLRLRQLLAAAGIEFAVLLLG